VGTDGPQSIDTEKLGRVCDYLATNRATIWTDRVESIAEYIYAAK
jgi:hypothetical protein